MAIYSLNLGFISRSAGRSTVGFSAYISGSRHEEAANGAAKGKTYRYDKKENVLVSRVLAPEGAPAWVLSPEVLWNHVERREDEIAALRFRPDPQDLSKTARTLAYKERFLASAQTAQTVMGAIPIELNQTQAQGCVENFLTTRFVSCNLVVHYAIHWEAGNPHFHALITRRPLVDGVFHTAKDRVIVSRDEHKITRKHWESVADFAFSDAQQNAIQYLCEGPDIRVLNGRAGTGKTTLLKVVAQAYQAAGYTVLGTSFQGKAVEVMNREIGIPCKTLHSLFGTWERHGQQKALVESGRLWGKPYLYGVAKMKALEKHLFTDKTVLFVDEANMIGGRLWEPLLREVSQKGAKVLIIQDTAQIKSRDPGDYGRLFAERYGTCDLRQVMRQKEDWQKAASVLFNEGQTTDALKPYQDKGHIHWNETASQTRDALVEAYLHDLSHNPQHNRIALAYRNKDVEALNQAIRSQLQAQGVLGPEFALNGKGFAVGDRVRFTRNDAQGFAVQHVHTSLFQAIKARVRPTGPQGVQNGTFGTLLEGDSRSLKVQLDDGRCVRFKTAEYAHLTHGYALGIHKSEGSTFDRAFVQLDPLLDASTLLVAMTRHRLDLQAFVNREEIPDFKALTQRVGRDAFKETVQDYHVAEAQKPYAARVQQYRTLLLKGVSLRQERENTLSDATSSTKGHASPTYQACLAEKKQLAREILDQWKDHKPYVRLAGLRREVLEVEAGLRQRTLSDVEHRASIQAQSYMDLVRQTRTLWQEITATHPPFMVKDHSQYTSYRELKAERDSLAAVLHETPALYGPFLRVVPAEKGSAREGPFQDYWGHRVSAQDRFISRAVPQHARAHLTVQQQRAFEERLTPEEARPYGQVKAYQAAAMETASLYHFLRQPIQERLVSREEVTTRFQERCLTRDRLAHEIAQEIPVSQGFLERLKIHEGKVLEHATAGEIRATIAGYQAAKDVDVKAEKAQALLSLTENKHSHSLIRLLKEAGVSYERLRFDILYAEKSSRQELAPQSSPDRLYGRIQAYQEAAREVGRAWKADVPAQDSQRWEEARQGRQDAARKLLGDADALCVYKALFPQRLTTLEAHGRQPSQPREVRPFWKAEHVLEAGHGRIRELAQDLLGAPNPHLSVKSTLRFGSHGKISVHIAGDKEGLWHDFSTGLGGSILQLIQQEKGLSFREAVAYGAWFWGVSERMRDDEMPLGVSRGSGHAEKELESQTGRLQAVDELHRQARPLEGTPAERYLREIRGIKGDLPPDLGYLTRGTTFTYQSENKRLAYGCLAAFGRNASGALCVVQLIKLQGDGTRACDPKGEKLAKLQYGVAKCAFVQLQNDPESGRVFLAEGVETALSLKEAGIGGSVVASLGIHNMKNYQGPEPHIILCADNDGPHARTNAIISHTQKSFEAAGHQVIVIRPTPEGHDFNDVLKEGGVQAVRAYVTEPALRLAQLQQTSDLAGKSETILRLSETLGDLLRPKEERTAGYEEGNHPLVKHAQKGALDHQRNNERDQQRDEKGDLGKELQTALHKDPDLLRGLLILNPEDARDLDTLMQPQVKIVEKEMGR